jgi:hypothetical protein
MARLDFMISGDSEWLTDRIPLFHVSKNSPIASASLQETMPRKKESTKGASLLDRRLHRPPTLDISRLQEQNACDLSLV